MAWKWYEITSYKASIGRGGYYGAIQFFGDGFYGLVRFHGAHLPDCSAPNENGQRFYGHLDYRQMRTVMNLLRHEKVVRIGWYERNPNIFHIMSGDEPAGDGDGFLAMGMKQAVV